MIPRETGAQGLLRLKLSHYSSAPAYHKVCYHLLYCPLSHCIAAILQIQVYAIYSCSQRLLGFMSVCYVATTAVAAWATVKNTAIITCRKFRRIFSMDNSTKIKYLWLSVRRKKISVYIYIESCNLHTYYALYILESQLQTYILCIHTIIKYIHLIIQHVHLIVQHMDSII